MNSKSPARPSHSGRPMTVRTTENIAAVKESVLRDPKKSVRRRSQELRLKRQSLLNILRKDLNLFPYRIQMKQTLSPADIVKRVDMCRWFIEQLDVNPAFLDNVWFSDEAHFLLSGHVSSKNNVFWGRFGWFLVFYV